MAFYGHGGSTSLVYLVQLPLKGPLLPQGLGRGVKEVQPGAATEGTGKAGGKSSKNMHVGWGPLVSSGP